MKVQLSMTSHWLRHSRGLIDRDILVLPPPYLCKFDFDLYFYLNGLLRLKFCCCCFVQESRPKWQIHSTKQCEQLCSFGPVRTFVHTPKSIKEPYMMLLLHGFICKQLTLDTLVSFNILLVHKLYIESSSYLFYDPVICSLCCLSLTQFYCCLF